MTYEDEQHKLAEEHTRRAIEALNRKDDDTHLYHGSQARAINRRLEESVDKDIDSRG